MVGHLPEPEVEHIMTLQTTRHSENADGRDGEEDGVAHVGLHLTDIASGILLGDLRLERLRHRGGERHHHAVDRGGDGGGGIVEHAEEDINKKGVALLRHRDAHVAVEVETREGQDGAEHGLVPYPVETALLEMADAVDAVDAADEQRDTETQRGIELHPVERTDDEHVDDEQLEHGVEQFHVCKLVHVLMGDDARTVGSLRETHNQHQYRTLIYPQGGIESAFGEVELVQDKPQSHGLGQHHGNERQHEMADERSGKHLAQLVGVAAPHLIGEKARGGTRHGSIQETHHADDTTSHTIQAVVGHAQRVEHHTRGVDAHERGDERAERHHHGIARHPAVAGKFFIFGHGLWSCCHRNTLSIPCP